MFEGTRQSDRYARLNVLYSLIEDVDELFAKKETRAVTEIREKLQVRVTRKVSYHIK